MCPGSWLAPILSHTEQPEEHHIRVFGSTQSSNTQSGACSLCECAKLPVPVKLSHPPPLLDQNSENSPIFIQIAKRLNRNHVINMRFLYGVGSFHSLCAQKNKKNTRFELLAVCGVRICTPSCVDVTLTHPLFAGIDPPTICQLLACSHPLPHITTRRTAYSSVWQHTEFKYTLRCL